MELERCMEWIRPDELIEVTPVAIRLRKRILNEGARKRAVSHLHEEISNNRSIRWYKLLWMAVSTKTAIHNL